jgi:hypothetical protein
MITSSDFYDIYSAKLKKELRDANNALKAYNSTKNYFVKQLQGYAKIISRYCDLSFEEIVESTLMAVLKEYDKCMFSFTGGVNLSKDEAIRITVRIIDTNRLIRQAEVNIKKLQEQLVDERTFKVFLRSLNKHIKEAILYKGYSFNFGGNVSSIFVERKKRYIKDDKADGMSTIHNNVVIDWGSSNKKKAEIIERGGTPYKAIKDENGVIVGDNGGEKWLVPFTDEYGFWLGWEKKKCTLTNKSLYRFSPARGVIVGIQDARKDENVVATYLVD